MLKQTEIRDLNVHSSNWLSDNLFNLNFDVKIKI